MRKLLGLLVAVAFVAIAAGNAMAINITTSTANGTAKFSAEWAFYQLGTAEFGFELLTIADANVKPASGDVAAAKIHWTGAPVAPVAGTPGARASKVYAKITNKAYTQKTKVLFYTNNTDVALSTTQYKYTINASTPPYGAGSPQTLNALVEKDGSTGANTSAGFATLPLAYRIEASTKTDFDITSANFTTEDGRLFFVTDKAKTVNPPDAVSGDPGSAAYTEAYATISTPSGMKEWDYWANSNIEEWFFFFASDFENARNGYSYGTDSLTVQLVVEP
jgi:hypothetical protein